MKRLLCWVAVAGWLSGSAQGAVPGLQSAPLPLRSHAGAPTLFTRLPASATGITGIHKFPTNGSFELLQDQGAGAGICVGDFDQDGRPDIFVTHYDQGNRLYHNLGGWRFEEVAEKAGVSGKGRWCAGATAADVDNDGDLDLHVSVYNGPNLLFLNRGDAVFDEQAAVRGLAFSGASVAMAFDDYDRDGLLDGHLVTHRLAVGPDFRLPRNSNEAFPRGILQVGPNRVLSVNPRFSELFEVMSKGNGRSELIIAGQRDHLYRGAGNGKFAETTDSTGILGNEIGLANAWWDYDADGWPDLYVSNDYKGSDRLYRNNRDGTFTDVASQALPFVPWSSMGSDSADLNNDGLMDLIATDMSGSTRLRRLLIHSDEKEHWFLQVAHPHQYPRNAVYLGTQGPRVFEVGYLTGLANTDWTWSPKFADFDNDGWVDLFVANGMTRDFVNADLMRQMRDRSNRNWLKTPVLRERNHAFRNMGDLRFQNVAKAWGLDAASASYGAAVADLDRDGDLDLLVTSFGEALLVYRNESTNGHCVLIRLKGLKSNSWGVGTGLRLETASGVQTRRLTLASGFMSANEPLVHFGLGDQRFIERLIVSWPSGRTQTFTNLEADSLLTITEPSDPPSVAPAPVRQRAWFRPAKRLAEAVHREQDFDDFAREPLLPWSLSRLGPGLACGDLNGDKKEDLFLGGAAGQPASPLIRNGDGNFGALVSAACFAQDLAHEDMGILIFDADSDGDNDVYVVSGGVECAKGDEVLTDRLYVNDGRGVFSRAPESVLPKETDSGSFVAAADFDRDGDLDLFVGGRCVPGNYPQSGRNRLLRNESGRFVDVTDEVGIGLRQTGLATSGLWTDVDADGWIDLLLAHEWGPIRLFRNQAGRLEEQTAKAQLAGLLGWWTGIAAGDFDQDGDIDYLIGNLGLNTKYQASRTAPVLAFLGDFANSGVPQLIEAEFEANVLFARRRQQTLQSVIPSITSRYSTIEAFASTRLEDLLGAAALAKAQRFEMNALESGILINDGTGRFSFRPLPTLAQAAPTFGCAVADVNADGHPDIYLVQNFSGPEVETGAMNGGMSLLLKGGTDGRFSPIWPAQSGLVVEQDARSLVVTDLNDDGRPDFVVGINHGPVLAFENQADPSFPVLNVTLHGRPGNPTAVGARVTLHCTAGRRFVQEVYAGGGYLSQSTPVLNFGLGPEARPLRLEVRWPSGRTNSVDVPSNVSAFSAREPAIER